MKKFGLKKCGVILALAAALTALASCSHTEESSGYSYTPTPPASYPTPSTPTVTVEESEYKNAVKVKWTGDNWSECAIVRFALQMKNENEVYYFNDKEYGSEDRECLAFINESGVKNFRVKLTYDEGDYHYSNSYSDVVSYNFTYTPLLAPTNVKATRVSSNKIQISWDSTKAMGYKVYCSSTQEGSLFHYKELVATVGKDTTSCEIDNPYSYDNTITAIYFYVAAYDEGGQSPYSDEVNYTFGNQGQ